ncbi:hypothetical protein GLYMA_17G261350v4 [Glycine max]|nr:hypothetical protein GLYMA_17G261350v4 [Glycine max]KAH1120218.1 hypothetical protein GYH30_048530 [Glycine max]
MSCLILIPLIFSLLISMHPTLFPSQINLVVTALVVNSLIESSIHNL